MQAFVDSIRAAIAAATDLPDAGIRLESPKNPEQGEAVGGTGLNLGPT